MLDQITVVVGVDAKTLPQFEVSHRTWKLHRPEMYSQMPWVVFYDGDNLSIEHGVRRLMDDGGIPANAEVVAWPQCLGLPRKPKYENQRDKMLSGHVWVPATAVQTPLAMKIDTDVLALGPSDWIDERWFAADSSGRLPAWVAPRWGYSKGVNALGRLHAWTEIVPELAARPPLDIKFDPTHMRCPHERMCSWVSYYSVRFLNRLASWLWESDYRGTLPVPSQDGTVWYAAERAGEHRVVVSQKALRWTNCPKINDLIQKSREVLTAASAPAIEDS